jgi:hypothetical protein
MADSERAYHSRITRDFGALLLVICIGSAALILVGISYTQILDLKYGAPFVALGVASMVIAALYTALHLGQTVHIRADGIECRSRFRTLDLAWQEIADFNPQPRGLFSTRRAIVGDGRRRFAIDSGFFEDYDQIVSLIVIGRRRHRETWLLVNRPQAG